MTIALLPPPEKSHFFFPSNPSLKVEVLSRPPLLNLVGGSTSPCRKGGAHYVTFTETDKLRLEHTQNSPRTLEFKSFPVFPL